jgi:DNA-binding CsgD family transcriptional regulator
VEDERDGGGDIDVLIAGIYRAAAGGAAPQQIAARTGVSVNTVRTQLALAFQKLGVGRQAELAAALGGLAGL